MASVTPQQTKDTTYNGEDITAHTLEVKASNEDRAVNKAERWVEHNHDSPIGRLEISSVDQTGTQAQRGMGILPSSREKNIYTVTVYVWEGQEQPAEPTREKKTWQSRASHRQRSYNTARRHRAPPRRAKAFSDRTKARFKEAIMTPEYYRNRILAKGRMSDNGRISLHLPETETVGANLPTRMDGALIAPQLDEPVYMWDARLNGDRTITVRKEYFEGHGRGRDSLNWVQVMLAEGNADPVREMKTMGSEWYFNRLIWKNRINKTSEGVNNTNLTIRQPEWKQLGITSDTRLRVTLMTMEGKMIPKLTEESVFTAKPYNVGNSMVINMKPRMRLQPRWGKGKMVQAIAKPMWG